MTMLLKPIPIFTIMVLGIWTPAQAEPIGYASPEDAVEAVITALDAGDRDAVLQIFGRENEDIYTTGDPAKDKDVWGGFLRDYKSIHRIEREAPDQATLLTGRDFVAFPAPLVLKSGSWSFDSVAARSEILMRRIGANELAVIAIMQRARGVQEAFRRVDHDGDGVMEFAAGILSSPGVRDGLYWQDEPGTETSPFDASIARASLTGYREGDKDFSPDPYMGYYFRILQGQGASAPGGAYSYLVNNNMISGYAVLAVPAAYGDTGRMTFMVGENGIIYEADLGVDSLEKAGAIELFDPDQDWHPVDLGE